MEKYSRGRRGAPAKGVGRATGARVQIPLSPLAQEENREVLFSYITRLEASIAICFSLLLIFMANLPK